MNIALLHPFTPKSAGVVEASVSTYHSQPHVNALKLLAKEQDATCFVQYFTTKYRAYEFTADRVIWQFFPVSWQWNGNHKKWQKQASKACYNNFRTNCPDVTIINTSGKASRFCYDLSKLILSQGKQYIAMLGGQHYEELEWRNEYFRKAHHLLVHTRSQIKSMQALPVFEGLDIRMFPLGIDLSVFTPGTVLKKDEGPQLLFVGRITELKRIQLAVRCVAMLKQHGFPDVHLNIIGPVVSDTYFQELKSLVASEALSSHVTFLGHKHHEALVEFYQKADLLLLPSETESFGMVMIESMACGTPVAAIEGSGGPDEVIENGQNGILVPMEEYGKAIVELFDNPTRLAAIRSRAVQTVTLHYSIASTYEVLHKSVNDCLK